MTAGSNNGDPPPIRSIVVGSAPIAATGTINAQQELLQQQQQQQFNRPNGGSLVTIDTSFHRVVHKVRLSALSHNYSEVESAANRQRCSVIVVVKADGYGHGAIPSALFLADKIGADAFAVATLEEGIALRKALRETAATTPGSSEHLDCYFNVHQTLNHKNNGGGRTRHLATTANGTSRAGAEQDSVASLASNVSAVTALYGNHHGGKTTLRKRRDVRRSANVRILVLGPPLGFPRCFDDYYHYNIEAMISGPEVAMALYEWVSNTDERKRLQVERAANELKEKILSEPKANKTLGTTIPNTHCNNNNNNNTNDNNGNTAGTESGEAATSTAATNGQPPHAAASSAATNGDNNSQASHSSSGRSSSSSTPLQSHIPSATLTNVTGSDLAKEVREILKNQKLAAQTQKQQQQELEESRLRLQRRAQLEQQQQGGNNGNAGSASSPVVTPVASGTDLAGATNTSGSGGASGDASALVSAFAVDGAKSSQQQPQENTTETNNSNSNGGSAGTVRAFAGLEEIARHSRIRQKAMASEVFHDRGGDDEDEAGDGGDNNSGNGNREARIHATNARQHQKQNHDRSGVPEDGGDAPVSSPIKPKPSPTSASRNNIPTNTNRKALPTMTLPNKKRLRWHALVDSGMGRLGFKADLVASDEKGKRRDTVEILKELVDLESTLDCPVEFYGMCTHMADASNSTFTVSQMNKFKGLLKRVRAAGISVPTISTDNSAALLTTNLTHFSENARELLAQTDADSRGFVRTGGAIYGQRPTFPQLRAVSTLLASVRHVAVLRKGESVGYDRAYVAPTNVRIATLTIGFADGYPRDLGNGVGRVSIKGNLFPVAGNVCMDMLMVELGPAEERDGAGAGVVVGDTAILWGPDDGEEGEGHVRLRDVAATLKTTQSELTCGLNKERVLQQYA